MNSIPDANAVAFFRERLRKAGVIEELFLLFLLLHIVNRVYFIYFSDFNLPEANNILRICRVDGRC